MKQTHDILASRKRKMNYEKKWFKKGVELLKKEKITFNNVVDVGAGKGEFLDIIKSSFEVSKLTGIDYIVSDLEVLRSKGIEALKIDLDKLDVNQHSDLKNKYDLVVSLETIEHIFYSDNLFRFFNFILGENGYLLISTPNTGSFHYKLFYLLRGFPYGENHHVRFFNKDKLGQYSIFNGFDIISWNNYFTLQTDIVKRGFGIRNSKLVKVLAGLLFGPLSIIKKIAFFDSLSNNGLVVLLKKTSFKPLGLEIDNFKNNFKVLSTKEKKHWAERIRKYHEKDNLSEHVYFRNYIDKIIND